MRIPRLAGIASAHTALQYLLARALLPFVLRTGVVLLLGTAANAEEVGWHQARRLTYEGALELQGHYSRPGDTRHFHSRHHFYFDGRGGVLLDWITWPEGDSAGAPESFLTVAGRTFHKEEPGASWRELTGVRGEQARFHVKAGVPGAFRKEDAPRAHPRLGDVTDRLTRSEPDSNGFPITWSLDLHERDHQWRLKTTRVSAYAVPESLLAIPVFYEPAPEHPDSLVGKAVVRQLAEGVWAVDLEDIDSRSLVVEFQDHLAVIEAAASSANGERMVDAVKRRWPLKPIRYALFSHHHPHYLGGLRALIAEGATVVTTPGNDSLVHAIGTYSFRLEPDRLALTQGPGREGAGGRVHVLPFPARIELSDSTNRLVAINIGERSQHTAEFVIFWLPRQRLLFEAEQGWFTSDGELRAGRRAAKLLEILNEERLEVDRIVQSWPMRGTEPELSVSRLAELVNRRR